MEIFPDRSEDESLKRNSRTLFLAGCELAAPQIHREGTLQKWISAALNSPKEVFNSSELPRHSKVAGEADRQAAQYACVKCVHQWEQLG